MRRNNDPKWEWYIAAIDSKFRKVDIIDLLYDDFPDLYEEIGEAVEELRKKYCKFSKAKRAIYSLDT